MELDEGCLIVLDLDFEIFSFLISVIILTVLHISRDKGFPVSESTIL